MTEKNRTKYQTDYKKAHYKRVPVEISKEKYQEIKEHIETRSETVNGFIKRAIDETIQNDKKKNDTPI